MSPTNRSPKLQPPRSGLDNHALIAGQLNHRLRQIQVVPYHRESEVENQERCAAGEKKLPESAIFFEADAIDTCCYERTHRQ